MTNDIIDSGERIHRVVDVDYAGDYRLNIRFADNRSGIVDLSELLDKPAFSALRDKAQFKRYGLEHGTITWSHQLDVAPEWLYEQLR